MVDLVFVTLLAVHVASIVSWMGGAVLFVSVITPSLRSMSPMSRGEFLTATLPRYFRFIQGSAIASVLAGLALYGYMISSNQAPTGNSQISLSIGALLGLIAFGILFAIGVPAGKKMISLMKQMGKGPGEDLAGQVAAQQRKIAMASRIGVALLGTTLILMVLAAELG
jgi:uncharacterized membrane protein